ncbi:MAG TPA: J domain-containing protein [Candidatus Limnocylindria bacterium]|nr:J domain-containing protein [Candidatus Limnocylindria bacterium]
MEYRDYYQVLGVPRSATRAEVKKAYRRLARELHPDRNPGDSAAEKRFKEANEAHAVLSDPEKRKHYDELGANWQAYQQTGFGSGGTDWAGFGGAPGGMRWEVHRMSPDEMGGQAGDVGGFSDFFRAFFGSGSGGFDFDTLTRPAGSARRGGAARTPAPTAAGTAEVTLTEVARGTVRMVSVDGRRIQVTIPAGVADDARIRLRGAGVRGSDGVAGDLLITVRVLPDPRFERRGADLVTELPITLAEALLGAEVPVPTPTGSVKLRVRPGTHNGQEIHLAGRGLPRRAGPATKAGGTAATAVPARGDLVVRVLVVLPELDDASRAELAEALAKHPQPDPRADRKVH